MKHVLPAFLVCCTIATSAATAQPADGVAPTFEIGKVTFAVTYMDAMVRFYSAVFQTEMKPFTWMGATFYSGRFLGMNVLFCPNTIAGVDAKQNRHQFDVLTNDIEGARKRAAEAGGSVQDQTDPGGGPKTYTFTDADGNTIVFIEKR